jgi:hypothetical protein
VLARAQMIREMPATSALGAVGAVAPLASAASVALVALIGFGWVPLGACNAMEPSNKPVDTCVRACKTRAARSCTEGECMRGCEFILDRLVEKEGDNVIACVARTPRRCTDVVWADCAARIGVHADGGPPAPPPPRDDD